MKLVLCILSAAFLAVLPGCSDDQSGRQPDSGSDAADAQDAFDAGDPPGDDGGDVVADADSKSIDWEALNGTVPAQPMAAPEFTARNRDDTTRTRQDLIGHPTVIWFYPKANTSG